MIQTVKTKLARLLQEKAVSLAMLYNKEGEILWARGRKIRGKTIHDGEGFSKTYIKETLKRRDLLERENVIVSTVNDGLPESAVVLKVKCLVIQPISDNFYLYIDSGIKESFSKSDREIFTFMGELLGDMVESIRRNGAETGGIAGDSPAIKRIRELVLKYSLEEEPILLLGETGSGKSHIAELIHKYSGRKGKFFVVNTPGIPDTLFESEMFGHRKGAFTDARCDKKGFVDEAEGGTLFFDEISEVPVSFQAKLLRFIETRKYLVLGESIERDADVRIVAATNINLHDAIKKKEFREDLYYRLQVLEIEIPPLRERKDDIKALVSQLMPLLKGKETGSGFWEAVYSYQWPGNVRELITVLTRAGILMDGPITGKDIRDILNQSSHTRHPEPHLLKIEQIWNDIQAGRNFWETVKEPFLERDLNREEVKEIIRRGLAQTGGKYKNLLELFHLKANEYKRLMKFINGNRLNI